MLTSYDQSSTLRFAAPNMFRFELDNAQLSAGLGGYAYHRLGWRNVTTVGEDDAPGWSAPAGFDAEFCGLGGHIRRLWAPGGAGGDTHWMRRVSSATDGVFLAPGFYTGTSEMSDFLRRWAPHHDPARRLVVGWDADPADPRLSGVVTVSSWPWAKTPALRRYKNRFRKAFPKIKGYVDAMTYYDEVEPLLEALEKVHGDTSGGEQSLQHALANLHYNSPIGSIHLDGRNQAIGPTYLGRIGGGTVHQLAVIHNVDETFGGYFGPHSTPPGPHSPACVKRSHPPPSADPPTR
jgi:branched-chain amino acid transport system substrate-binding protein